MLRNSFYYYIQTANGVSTKSFFRKSRLSCSVSRLSNLLIHLFKDLMVIVYDSTTLEQRDLTIQSPPLGSQYSSSAASSALRSEHHDQGRHSLICSLDSISTSASTFGFPGNICTVSFGLFISFVDLGVVNEELYSEQVTALRHREHGRHPRAYPFKVFWRANNPDENGAPCGGCAGCVAGSQVVQKRGFGA